MPCSTRSWFSVVLTANRSSAGINRSLRAVRHRTLGILFLARRNGAVAAHDAVPLVVVREKVRLEVVAAAVALTLPGVDCQLHLLPPVRIPFIPNVPSPPRFVPTDSGAARGEPHGIRPCRARPHPVAWTRNRDRHRLAGLPTDSALAAG